MAEMFLVRRKLKLSLWFTAAAFIFAVFAAFYFHRQLVFSEDEASYKLSVVVAGTLLLGWIGQLIVLIFSEWIFNRKLVERNRRFPVWIIPAILLVVFISGMAVFLYKETQRQMDVYTLLQKGLLDRLEQRLEEEPERLNEPTAEGMTLLMLAVQSGQSACVDLLLARGADVSLKSKEGKTALFYAMNDPAMIEKLLAAGASPDEVDPSGNAPVHYAISLRSMEAFDLLVKSSANLNINNKDRLTPLMMATELGELGILRELVEQGADINGRDWQDRVPLHVAASRNYLEVASFLLENGATLVVYDNSGMSPLHLAAQIGNLEMVKLFVPRLNKVDMAYRNGYTPLICAFIGGQYEVAQYLVDHGADVNRRLQSGNTMLHGAVTEGRLKVVDFLINNYARTDVEDRKGETVDEWIEEQSLDRLKAMIRARDAKAKAAETNDVVQASSPPDA